jgi:flagellar biosynthesis anti-sigma factor FlgM
MRIGGAGELENLRKSLARDEAAQSGRKAGPEKLAGRPTPEDGVEVSSQAKMLGKLQQVPEVRQERIEAIKQEIAEGRYLTPERVKSGIRKMLENL